MTAFAIVTGLFTLGVPAAVVLGNDGYDEDHRKTPRRKARDGRAGGRRQSTVRLFARRREHDLGDVRIVAFTS